MFGYKQIIWPIRYMFVFFGFFLPTLRLTFHGGGSRGRTMFLAVLRVEKALLMEHQSECTRTHKGGGSWTPLHLEKKGLSRHP